MKNRTTPSTRIRRSSNVAIKLLLSGILSWLLLITTCFATSFINRPFPEIVQDAPVILRGKVLKTYSDWGKGPDGGRRIYTFAEIDVREVFKGSVQPNSVVIREIGGEKDGVGMQVSGASQFSQGEDIVVMLSDKNEEGSFSVRGLMMGKFNVEHPNSGEEFLTGPGLRGRQIDTDGQKKVLLQELRDIIRSQPSAPPDSVNTEKSTSFSPPPQAAPASAPRLQNSSPEEPRVSSEHSMTENSGIGFFSRYVLPWLCLGALITWAVRRRR